MKMVLLTLDPRFPLPDSISITDAEHPLNLVKSIKEAQAQAAQDKQFDPPLPKRLPRKESFRSQYSFSFFLVIGMILCGFYTLTGTFEQVLQLFLLFAGIAGLILIYHTL